MLLTQHHGVSAGCADAAEACVSPPSLPTSLAMDQVPAQALASAQAPEEEERKLDASAKGSVTWARGFQEGTLLLPPSGDPCPGPWAALILSAYHWGHPRAPRGCDSLPPPHPEVGGD